MAQAGYVSVPALPSDWRVVPVTPENAGRFVAYARRFGPEHDDSHLPDAGFLPGPDDPGYLLLEGDGEGEVAGAVSLLLHPSFRQARKARFRILHAREADEARYGQLLEAVRPHLRGLNYVYLFVPEERTAVRGILERLGLAVERYSWCLARPAAGVPEPVFPEGYELRPFTPGADDLVWCGLVNLNFASLQGHLTLTPDRLARWLGEAEHLAEGMLILWRGELPVGTLRVIRGEEPGSAEITSLSVLPGCRGQSLGTNLLRAGVAVGRRDGLDQAVLSVNAENQRAAELYLREGFRRVKVMVCYGQRPA